MFILFFTIVLIAQLIVAYHIVTYIIALDKKVCAISQTITEARPQIVNQVTSFKSIIKTISKNLDCFNDFVIEKSKDCQTALKKNLITTILFYILKIPGKRILTIIDIIMMIKKVYTGLKK